MARPSSKPRPCGPSRKSCSSGLPAVFPHWALASGVSGCFRLLADIKERLRMNQTGSANVLAEGDETLRRVHAILMPLEAECDFGLPLSAEANDLIQVLIGLHIHAVGNKRQNHLGALPQNSARLDLVHEAAFA